jgi:NADPH:quinone reductase-like Zn-dependent oxidoreductase
MKAVVYDKFGGSDVLQFRDIPDPLPGEGEVLVEVFASSVNPIDIKVRSGSLRAISGKRFPRIPGADLSGKVLESRHPRFKTGDKVYGMSRIFRGGCHAEKIALPANCLSPKPATLSHNTAAILPLTGLTCIQALVRKCKLRARQEVLINGCTGGVGSLAVQLAAAKQAMVTGVCSEKNAGLATKLGADHVVSYENEDLYRLGRFDIIFDAAGKMNIHRAKKMLRAGGKYITTAVGLRIMLLSFFSARINYVNVKPDEEDLRYLSKLVEEKMLTPLIDRDYPLDQLARAHDYVEKGHSRGKVLIRVRPAGQG